MALGERGASVRSLALVEVRKSVEASTWYHASLLDVCAGLAVVSFEDNLWPDREVPCNAVRARAVRPNDCLAALRPGDAVEVLLAASARCPSGWTAGLLGSAAASGSSCTVRVGAREYEVEPHCIRPTSTEGSLDPLAIARRAVPVDPDLRAWLTTSDASGCLEHVRATANLLLAGAGTGMGGAFASTLAPGGASGASGAAPEGAGQLPDAVVLLGSETATRRGEMLLHIHLMHQKEVEAHHARVARKSTLLEALRDQEAGVSSSAKASFQVAAELVGRSIGKKGERLRKVEEERNVEVRVLDAAEEGAPRMVVILGDDDEDVAAARLDFELCTQAYPVDAERVGWILSKVQEIAQSAGLASAKWEEEEKVVQLCGTRSTLDDAVLLLDNHNEYWSVFEDMRRQDTEIKKSFEALNEAEELVGLAPSRPRRKPGAPDADGPPAGGAARRQPSAGRKNEGKGGRGRGGRGGRGQQAAPEQADEAAAAPEVAPEADASTGVAADGPSEGRGGRGGRGRGGGGRGTARGAGRSSGGASAGPVGGGGAS